jgi:3',5'-cyclic AMP phosphodiesterase CpdA
LSTCVLHVSDLHLGARNGLDDPALEREIGSLIDGLRPDLVVASGDLTHGGKRDEHEAAAAYLRALGPPLFVVPGNHDIPPWPPRRLMRPFQEFEREWGGAPPLHSSAALFVVGLNSVNPWGYQRGRLREAELERATEQLRTAEPGALRVVVLHHQLAGTPWRWKKLPLAARTKVLRRLTEAGADLIIGGHIHQATVNARRDFEVLDGEGRDCVLATAPGLGRPRPGRRYEVRGVLVHRSDATSLTVETHVWDSGRFALVGARTFPRDL